ncbi:Uncharacterized protein OBRU01_19286 [Operophtera brumata]|uniref:Uncharacterized protein n=1 Tax=Operophtera brumata TaxID=104452 RepID=A0A0L7KW84_OPEBR|nr:Uncharacterized protein OBRU01_19286 [Operophtera brumata]
MLWEVQEDKEVKVQWTAICEAFCLDGYALGGEPLDYLHTGARRQGGCPACEPSTPAPAHGAMTVSARALATADGWAAWCDVQCRQGHGGAACSCDRTPFQ